MKFKILLPAIFIFVLTFTYTTPAFAQVETLNLAAQLVPCEGGGADAENPCTACHLIELANNVIIWLIGILTMVFAILVMVAGFKLVTSGGNASAKESAKKMMTNALVGFILVMAAWIIIDTGMRALLRDDGAVFEGRLWWQSISCDGWTQSDTSQITQYIVPQSQLPRGNNEGAGAGTAQPPAANVDTSEYTHSEALAALRAGNFGISSSGGCSDRTIRTCTSLDGVKRNTISRIIQFQRGYGGQVVITGGTEVGHASGQYSHSNGYKLDLRRSSALDSYIQNTYTPSGSNRWIDPYGNIYWREDSRHWDVTITN